MSRNYNPMTEARRYHIHNRVEPMVELTPLSRGQALNDIIVGGMLFTGFIAVGLFLGVAFS